MRLPNEVPNLRWFENFGSCVICGKASRGMLRDDRNQSYGPHCQKCADKRLKDSKLVRENYDKTLAGKMEAAANRPVAD